MLNLLIQEKLSTKACSVFQFAGFKVVSNLLKDMYTILDEVHTMSLEVNILQHQIGIVGVLHAKTRNGKRKVFSNVVYLIDLLGMLKTKYFM